MEDINNIFLEHIVAMTTGQYKLNIFTNVNVVFNNVLDIVLDYLQFKI